MTERGTRFIVTTTTSVYITPSVTMNDTRNGVKILDMSNVGGPVEITLDTDLIENVVQETYEQEDVTALFRPE